MESIIDKLRLNFNYKRTIYDIEELYGIDAAIGDICHCASDNRSYVYTANGWIKLESGLSESPKIVYKSITNCTNCGGLLSWQSMYEPTVRCSYCGSILQKEIVS